MWIDTKIVYEPGKQLAEAYNRAMRNTSAEWVLFLDHDLFLCNPHWYEMSLNAVKQVGKNAGWITCKCNRIGNKCQLYQPQQDSNDILYHIEVAKKVYRKCGNEVVEVQKGNFSGFFILTSKTVWKKVGGFRHQGKGLSKVDIDYCKRVQAAGYKLYIMPGLYMYHLYKRLKGRIYKGFK